MAGYEGTRHPGQQETGLTVWDPVIKAIEGLGSAGLTAADLRNPLMRNRALTGQGEAARTAKEKLHNFIPSLSVSFSIDGTGSMSDDQGAVRAHLAPFMTRVIVEAMGSIPKEVQQQISQDRDIRWLRVDFGDGNPRSSMGGAFLSLFRDDPSQEEDVSAPNRIDMPYLRVHSGNVRFNGQNLHTAAEEMNSQFRMYETSFGGGGNGGESSPEAVLAAMGVLPENQLQQKLILKLLEDCQYVRDHAGYFDRYAMGARGRRNNEGDIVPYLQQLVAAGAVPVQALHALERESDAPPLFDIRVLVTDEPAAGYATTLEQIESLRPEGSLFLIITPSDIYEQYWKNHIQRLGAVWYNLDDLANAKVSAAGMNFAQKGFASAIAEKTKGVIIRDLTKVLQITDGHNKTGGTGSIVRV